MTVHILDIPNILKNFGSSFPGQKYPPIDNYIEAYTLEADNLNQ